MDSAEQYDDSYSNPLLGTLDESTVHSRDGGRSFSVPTGSMSMKRLTFCFFPSESEGIPLQAFNLKPCPRFQSGPIALGHASGNTPESNRVTSSSPIYNCSEIFSEDKSFEVGLSQKFFKGNSVPVNRTRSHGKSSLNFVTRSCCKSPPIPLPVIRYKESESHAREHLVVDRALFQIFSLLEVPFS